MVPGNPASRVVCAVVLLNKDYDALLQLRDEKLGLPASGLWVFPGGHKDPGEDIFSCANREFLEETNYKCGQLNWLLSFNDTFTFGEPALLHIFWETYKENKSYICLEGQALEFISRDNAPQLKIPEYLISIWDLAILAKDRFASIK